MNRRGFFEKEEMDRKPTFIAIGAVTILLMLACQTIAGSSPTPQVLATETPPVPTLTSTPEGSTLTLPFDFWTDPNTACAIYEGQGLSCLDKDGWHKYELKLLMTIAQCPDGQIYLGVREQKLGPGPEYGTYVKFYALANNTLFEEVGHDVNPHTFGVDAIACGAGNELWVSYAAGTDFAHFDGAEWTDYNDNPEGLTSNNKVEIAIAPNGNLWAAMDGSSIMGKAGSLVTFDGTEWHTIRELRCNSQPTPGTPFRFCPGFSGVTVDEKGNVWAGSNDGLEKYDGVQWTVFPDPEQFSGRVLFYKEEKVWMLYKEGIWTFDPRMEKWDLHYELGVLSDKYVREVQFDGQGRPWLVAKDGLYVYDGSAWIHYDMETADLFGDFIDDIIVFGDGPVLLR